MNLPMPPMAVADPRLALGEMQRYLWRLAEELNTTLEQVERDEGTIRRTVAAAVAEKNTDPRATFNAIKALIIQSADIVERYYETISARLEGRFVAQSDFGVFVQQTTAAIEAASTGITQLYENWQELRATVEGFDDILLAVSASIHSGYLYTDENGVDRYGLEIGERVEENGELRFLKHARFTSDRLSFYDANDTEIAWISDYTLHITNAEISGGLTLGRYLMEGGNGLAFRWVG